MNEKSNLIEDTSLIAIQSFGELIEYPGLIYILNGCLIIKNISFNFEIGADFYTNIKKEHSTIAKLRFDNCVFLCNVSCKNSIFEYSLNFHNSIFKSEADFGRVIFKGEAYFWNTKFESKAYFWNAKFEGKAYFSEAKFESEAAFGNAKFEGEAYFSEAKFESEANFMNAKFEGAAYFGSAEFESEANFRVTKFKDMVCFLEAKFKGIAYFMGAIFEGAANFAKVIFEGAANFSNAKFEDEAFFLWAIFKDILEMIDVKFLGKLTFRGTRFKKQVNLRNCDFIQTVEFVNISSIDDFDALLSFDFSFSNIENFFIIDIRHENRSKDFNVLINGDIDFKYCFFKKDSVVILRNITDFQKENKHEINFEYANIHGNIVMQDIKYNSLSLENATVMGSISLSDNAVFKQTAGRHTDCVLKHESLKVNDIVNYLIYRKEEHVKIYKTLFKQKQFARGIAECIAAGLNRISNNCGQNWILGLGFTLMFAIIFYSLYIISTPEYSFANPFLLGDFAICSKKYWLGFIKFFWLPNGFNILTEASNGWGYIPFVIGKIAVGFGLYQTIAAFRRHGK